MKLYKVKIKLVGGKENWITFESADDHSAQSDARKHLYEGDKIISIFKVGTRIYLANDY